MLSDDLGEKKIFAKGLEFLHVVFNVIEKRGPVFLSLVFASFIKMPLGNRVVILHTQYLENEAKLSGKTAGHC